MDINHKKTALDEDSILYQKRDDSLKKKNLSSLSRKEKLQYFRDYYLAKVIIAIIAVILCSNLVHTIFFTNPIHILTIAVIGENYIEDAEGLVSDLRTYYELTSDEEEIYISNYTLEDSNQQMAFSTKLLANDIDLIICDPNCFDRYCAQGFFYNLSEHLPTNLYQAFSNNIINGSRQETDSNGNVIRTLPEAPYGIDVTENDILSNYLTTNSKAILGISKTTTVPDRVIQFLDYLQHLPLSPAEESEQAESQ